MDLRFEAIRTENFQIAYEFLRDSFRVSFGDDPQNWPNKLGELSQQSYFEIIQKKLSAAPESVIHVWQGNVIIGQIELSRKKDDQECGYVSLYYLIKEKRGSGLGIIVDQYAIEILKNKGCKKAQLTVDESNKSAIQFYKKQDWQELGPHPSYTNGLLMQKIFG